MKVLTTPLAGVLIIQPNIFRDERGFFCETYQQTNYQHLGLPLFLQDNHSHSKRHVLRGLHYQYPQAQGKLVRVVRGKVFDVVVDIRKSAKTFGQWFSIILNDEDRQQLYVPAGFAHGFCVISEEADFLYKCTDFYQPQYEHGIAWNDPQLNIPWPTKAPLLSPKDNTYSSLNEIKNEYLFP